MKVLLFLAAHVAIAAGLVALGFAIAGAIDPAPVGLIEDVSAPAHKVDYPLCLTVRPPRLLAPPAPDGAVHRSRDGGIT